MKKRVILIHGFNVKDEGTESIDRLIPILELNNYEVIQFDYGYLELIMVRFRTNFISKMLKQIVQPGDHIIGHSHGCAIIANAMAQGAKFNNVIFIHPALDSNWEIPFYDSAKKITVFYSPKDIATWFAQLLRLLSPLRLFGLKHFWGNMGSVGPKSLSTKFVKINDKLGHSGIFKNVDKWGTKIIDSLKY